MNEHPATTAPGTATPPTPASASCWSGADLPEHYGTAIGGPADLHELGLLVDTAGGLVVGTVHQKRRSPRPAPSSARSSRSCAPWWRRPGPTWWSSTTKLSPAQGRNLTKELSGKKDKEDKKKKWEEPALGPDGAPVRKTRVPGAA